MSYNSGSTSEEQLPEVFRRLGKTVPPRERRSYSGGQQTFDTRPRTAPEQQWSAFYQPQHNFQQANYSDIATQASNPLPIYYRPQMNNGNSAVGFHPSFNPKNNPNAIISNNNSNSNIPIPYNISSPSTTSAHTIPQNAFSFIPRDANQNSNPIISFVRNPNTGAMPSYGAPYQFFNGNMGPVDVNSGQQVLHPSPSVAPSATPSTAAIPPVSLSASKAATSGPLKSSHDKKDGSLSYEITAASNTGTSSRRHEQKNPSKQSPAYSHDSKDNQNEDTPTSQRDILAKSIKIIASRPLGADKNSGNKSRKHVRQSDSESSEPEDDVLSSTIVNRKVVVATDDNERSLSRERSPITKKTKRDISPTIPKSRRRSSSGNSKDDGARNSRARQSLRSPSPISVDRHSRSASRSLSRSISPPKRQRTSRQRSESIRTPRNHSPGSSSDEEKAPFLKNHADRYVPDYNRRPLPPQFRQRFASPSASRNLSLQSVSSSSLPHATNSSSAKIFGPGSSASSMNRRTQPDGASSKPKDLRSYPLLGTSSMSSDNSKISAETKPPSNATTSSGPKDTSIKKSTIISHKIITKPSIISKTKSKTTTASTSNSSNSAIVPNAAQIKLLPPVKQLNSVKNEIKMVPIKQEMTEEPINDASRQNKERNDGTTGRRGQTSINNETTSDGSTAGSSNRKNNANSPAALPLNAPNATNELETAVPSTRIAETITQNERRKRKVFTDAPTVDFVETSKSINGFSKALPSVNDDAKTSPPARQVNKTSTITQATRAAIKKRVAKEQERLDQERLRQLDIDDRDDIVMDIALSVQPRSVAPAMSANNNTVTFDATAESLSKEATSKTDDLATIHDNATKVLENPPNATKTSSVDGNVTPTSANGSISNHNTIKNSPNPMSAASSKAGHGNAPSNDTTTAGTNSAFTNMELSNDMSVPQGDTMLQSKSMSSLNSQMLPPPASLQQEPLIVVKKPLVLTFNNTAALPASAVPVAPQSTNKSKRLPKPWKAKMNDSGDIYYVNPVTGEVSFVRPE